MSSPSNRFDIALFSSFVCTNLACLIAIGNLVVGQRWDWNTLLTLIFGWPFLIAAALCFFYPLVYFLTPVFFCISRIGSLLAFGVTGCILAFGLMYLLLRRFPRAFDLEVIDGVIQYPWGYPILSGCLGCIGAIAAWFKLVKVAHNPNID
jgi:hypothetical protein